MNKKHLLALLCFICAAMAAYADGAFRNHRYDTFKVEPINEQSIVFVGNSITDMHLWSEAFGNDPRVVNRGNSGGLSSEILANVKSYCAGHPAKIFLMIGTNDNPSASTAPTIVGNIEKTIKAIQEESPKTEIYVESLLPSSYNRTNTGISAVNNAIKEMLKGYSTVTYVDLYSKLVGKCDNKTSGYSFDALHLTAAGYQIWLAEIEKYMGGLKSVYPTNTVSLQQNKTNDGSHGMRTTYFSMMPFGSSDVLFFGDEMVKNGEWGELLRNPNIKNRGTGWGYEGTYTVMSVVSNNVDATFANVSGVTKAEPKQILLYTGTGEINAGQAVNTVVNNYKKVVEKIRGYAPNAKICLVSLMPTRTYNNNARVKQFNSQIQDYAIEKDNVEYIDIYSALATTDDQPKDEYFPVTSDNYIYGDGYIAIANVLNRFIEGCSPITAKEAAANRDLIKGIVPKETPAVTVTDVKCDGTTPFPLSDEAAAAIKKMTAITTVIDYTSTQTPADWASIIGSSSTDDENFFSIGILKDGRLGVRYIGMQGSEGWYTRNKVNAGSSNQKIVVVQDPDNNGLLQLYIDGVQQYSFDNGSLGAYGCVTYNTRPGQSLYLGGLVTKSLTNKFPFIGTINSLRVYDKALTAEQIAELSYDLSDPGEEEKGPESISYTIDAANGYLQRNDGTVNANWNTYWYSNDEPRLELSAGVNNMTWSGNDVQIETGSVNSSTYTFKAPAGYLIKDVKFTAKAKTSGKTVSISFDGDTFTTSAAGQTFEKTDINKATFAFSLSGTNGNSTLLTDATVKVIRKDLVEPEGETIAEPDPFTVFATPQSGGVPYRIPAICTTADGTLVAIADYRFSRADIGSGRIDLHIRRSLDNGKTWEKDIIKPYQMEGRGSLGNGNDYVGFGDPCMVADRETGRILVMSCAGYPGFFQCTYDQHQRCARWYSDDNGLTWSEPEFIDMPYVFEPLNSAKNFGPAQGMFFGSGKIHQSRYVKVKDYYRLYASNSVRNSAGTIRNYVMYSDDFGQTWQFLGGVDGPAVFTSGDEPKVEELPNGNVLFSGRRNSAGGRNFNIFQFSDRDKAEGKWMTVAVSNAGVSGISNDNACNGEIQLVPVVRKKDGEKMWLALQSVPFGSGRNNVGIFYKPLDTPDTYDTPAHFAKKWEGQHQSSWTTSCYSTMTVQANKTIGFLYEENSKNNGYDIQYKNYTIETITDGKYSYDLDADPSITVMPLGVIDVTPANGNVDKLETITVEFTKEVTAAVSRVELAQNVEATVSVAADAPKTLVLTLTEALTAAGKYELTIPEGTVVDADEQENKAITLTYRILGEEQPLGATVKKLNNVSEHKTYALYNPHFTAYAIYAPEQNESAVWTANMIGDSGHSLVNPSYGEKCNFADPNTAWMLVEHNGKHYLYNVGAQQFVKVGRPTSFVAEPAAIQVSEISNGFAFNTTGGTQDYMCAAPQLSEPIAVWTSSDDGSCWQLIENPNVADDYDACMRLIDPTVVGLSIITSGNAPAEVYDLQGRRYEAVPLRRGVYVVGGRKVIK